MIQRGEQARLALEPRQPFGMGRERLGQHFDRDVASESRVARAIDLAHPALAEQGIERVDADAAADPLRGGRFFDQARRDLNRGAGEKPGHGLLVEERSHFALEVGLATAGLRHER